MLLKFPGRLSYFFEEMGIALLLKISSEGAARSNLVSVRLLKFLEVAQERISVQLLQLKISQAALLLDWILYKPSLTPLRTLV